MPIVFLCAGRGIWIRGGIEIMTPKQRRLGVTNKPDLPINLITNEIGC